MRHGTFRTLFFLFGILGAGVSWIATAQSIDPAGNSAETPQAPSSLRLVGVDLPRADAPASPPSTVPAAAAVPTSATAPTSSPIPSDQSPSNLHNYLAPGQWPSNTTVVYEPSMSIEEARKSFLQMQGQLDTALLAIERNRRESEAIAQRTKEEISTRLKAVERTLQEQRDRELEAVQQSNQNMLIIAGVFGAIGFLAMLLTSIFHMRAMNRLAAIASALPMGGAYLSGSHEALEDAEERLLAMAPGANPGTRLLSAIERLEKRVFELEHTSQFPVQIAPDPMAGPPDADASGVGSTAEAADPADASRGLPEQDPAAMLLGKAQALLSLGQAEESLECLDQVLARIPDHAEALVKKGTALEKLRRLDEAIECYDKAIHANQSMTLAYLYKGGLFNRMERYDEALACYELALKSQGKTAAPGPLQPNQV